jgi:hypothetical protein
MICWKEESFLETGIDASFQNNYSDPATKARRLIPNYDKYAAGFYSIFKYKISGFQCGGRRDTILRVMMLPNGMIKAIGRRDMQILILSFM